MLETLEREKSSSFPYEEYRPQLLTGVRAELDQLMCSLTSGLEVLRRQLLQDGELTRESSQDRLENLAFIVQQMNWLCGDLMDLAGWEERESQNVVADVSRQMEMFASVAQQQMEDIHWKGTVRYTQESTLYASVNCGYLYSACANILANLCYYGGQGDLHLNVTRDRAVELSVEGAFLPPVVEEILQSSHPEQEAGQKNAVGICGLLFVRLYCQAMGWRFELEKREDASWVRLLPPPLQVGIGEVEYCFSGAGAERRQSAWARQKLSLAFQSFHH